jgi:hypothetical protein
MTAVPDLVITGSSARRGGQVVARLRWAGKVITVIPAGTGKPAGRLVPQGYLSGRPDDGSGRYDAWTAKHPMVHTPSDRELRAGLPLAEAVASLLA